MALIQYGQEESDDSVIKEMRSDHDTVMSYGSQYALAYCVTGSNKAVGILTHRAVSDVNDDVHMSDGIGLAFVMYNTPDRVPQMLKLLLESFKPHIWYASYVVAGITMAGTGNYEYVSLLEPMLEDMNEFVR